MEHIDVSQVVGNATAEVKEGAARFIISGLPRPDNGRLDWTPSGNFSFEVLRRMRLSEVDVYAKAGAPKKVECRVVCELKVEEDMCNNVNTMHSSCSAFFVDVCSTIVLFAYDLHVNGRPSGTSVSQAIDLVCHSSASLGDQLRIVNTTMSVGGRTMSARTEIWNDTARRLVASGTHIKMFPSPPRQKL